MSRFEDNQQLSITGNIYNISQTASKCIIQVGRYFIDYRNDCGFSQGDRIRVIGRVQKGVIDNILGRLWLDSAELFVLESKSSQYSSDRQNRSFSEAVRENITTKYVTNLTEPEAGLVAGIVLGEKRDIGQEMYELMVRSGTIHIAVASGYNIMLVGGTVLSLSFWFVKRKRAVVIAVIFMAIYAWLSGGDPPVMRAVIMGAIIFWASCLGRRVISWWVLLVTGCLMVVIEPWLLTSVSFQLSMAASVGLMVLEPQLARISEKWWGKAADVLSGSGFLTSLSTMVTTMPIIWWNFSRVSWIGIVSNLLILPFVPILMILGVGMLVAPWLFSWPCYVVAHWMVEVIRFFGS